MQTELIPCRLEDLDILRAISSQTYYEAFAGQNSKETMRTYLAEAFSREKMLEELQNAGSRFYFLYADGKLAGYIKLNEAPAQTDINDEESLEIERIYVHKDFQGAGLGRVLMEYALQQTKAMGKSYAWLGVWEENPAAIGFYQRLGFRKVGEHHFRMGEELQKDWVMRHDL